MVVATHSLITQGLKPVVVTVEIVATRGKPIFVLIGLADRAMSEAKERISAAFYSLGLRIPCKRVVVNLAPADVHKKNSHLELAVAVALFNLIKPIKLDVSQTLFLGELSLDGQLRPIKGALVMTLAAAKMGFKRVVLPQANLAEVNSVQGIEIYPVSKLSQVLELVLGKAIKPLVPCEAQAEPFSSPVTTVDMADIRGQWLAKRALEITAAGGHNLLLIGPPGSGKTMLARALPSILPPLTAQESLEVTQLYSLKGLSGQGLIRQRPIRTPHHGISQVGLVGGGNDLQPGELSLAHHGVLFLDEFPEFSRSCLEALRQPLETGEVHLTRSGGQIVYPARFCLVAAANPCPCGYLGSSHQVCHCSGYSILRYQQKISGPIKDRIDLHLTVSQVETQDLDLRQTQPGESSTQIRERVILARKRQHQRLQKLGLSTNSELTSQTIKQVCQLPTAAQLLLNQAAGRLSLSARSYYKVIAVAQTIADLKGHDQIEKGDVSEALTYRY